MSELDPDGEAFRSELRDEFQKVLWSQYLLRYNLNRGEEKKLKAYFKQYIEQVVAYGKYVGKNLYTPIERDGISGDIDQLLPVLDQGNGLYQRLAEFYMSYQNFPDSIHTTGAAELEAIEKQLFKQAKLESTVLLPAVIALRG